VTELQTGTVARYCKPSVLDEEGNPLYTCFGLRETEKYLSIYLLDYFKKPTEPENITEVKLEMERKGFKLKPRGIFAVLDIEESKAHLRETIESNGRTFNSETISYRELNLPHCGIFLDYHKDLTVAALLFVHLQKSIKKCYPVKQV